MSQLSDIRDGVKTVIEAAITGLRVYPYEPDGALEYPCLLLESTGSIEGPKTLSGNPVWYDLTATLLLEIMDSDEGWREVEKYRSAGGAQSIQAAIRTDSTLNATAGDAYLVSSGQAHRGRSSADSFWEFSAEFTLRIYPEF